jgi:large-conductance mechanosensitive channel
MSEGFIQTGMDFSTFLANAAEAIDLSHPDKVVNYESELHKILVHIIPNTSIFVIENALTQYINKENEKFIAAISVGSDIPDGTVDTV